MLTRGASTLIRYDVDMLYIGMSVPADICDRHGTVLVAGGSVLDAEHLRLVRRSCMIGFYTPQSWARIAPRPSTAGPGAGTLQPPAQTQPGGAAHLQTSFSAKSLRPGMRVSYPLYDLRGVLLLAAHSTITPRFLELLEQRGFDRVVIDREPPATAAPLDPRQNTLTRRLDAMLNHLASPDLQPAGRTWHRHGQLSPAALSEAAQRELTQYERSIAEFEENVQHLLAGTLESISTAQGVVGHFIETLALDANIIPHILRLKTTPQEYLYHHCLNVSLLSMTIAAQMGFNRKQVFQVGIAALLADLGMLKIEEAVRLAPRPLSPAEYFHVQCHPLYTLDILNTAGGIDESILFIAYQSHERCDRSGYPRGRSGQLTHPLARIIAVADVYCAMTCPRPYREALSPYATIEAIMGQTRLGQFDPKVIRGLLDSVSLYPVGSRVLLSDRHTARVTRANAGQYDRPEVALLDDNGRETEIVDLSGEPDLKVVRVLE